MYKPVPVAIIKLAFLVLCSLLIGVAQANDFKHKTFAIGQWQITDTHYCPHICALDEKQASSYAGTVMEFSEFSASVLGETCNGVSYRYRVLTSDDFYVGHRSSPSDIGLNNEVVTQVSLHCGGPSELESEWSNFGSGFYIKNENEILTLWDGVYFLAKRIK